MLLLLFSLFSSSLAAPQLHDLSNLGNITSIKVEIGSNLFLSSNDNALILSRITLTNGNTSKLAHTLLNPLDEDGSMIPWTLTNADLTIVSTNDQNSTAKLTGYIYITTAEQAQDVDFHVYKVQLTQRLNVKKSSTVVLMTIQPARNDSAPIYQPFRNTLITDIVQKNTTTLRIYDYSPHDYYKNVTATIKQQIFSNPIDLTPLDTNHTYVFFDNVEPIQFPQKIIYLTVDDDVSLTVSHEWQDQIVYNTTAVTTTGMITYHLFEVNTTINFQLNPSNSRIVGLITTVENLWNRMSFVFSSDTSSSNIGYGKGNSLYNALYHTDLPATQLYGIPESQVVGIFYAQYFGIDGAPLPTTVPSVSSTQSSSQSTTTIPVSTTTSGVVGKNIPFFLLTILYIFI